MLPGNALIAYCPICGEGKELLQLMSGNTFGARFWSDTKVDAPMLPQVSFVQKCPHCGHYYLLSKVKTGYGKNRSTELGTLSFDETKEALAEAENWNLSSEEDYKLLFTALWAYNDLERYGKEVPDEDYQYAKSIIEKLIPLTEDMLLKAELYRELENYDECLKILRPFDAPDSNQKRIAKLIVAYAEKRIHTVVAI